MTTKIGSLPHVRTVPFTPDHGVHVTLREMLVFAPGGSIEDGPELVLELRAPHAAALSSAEARALASILTEGADELDRRRAGKNVKSLHKKDRP